MNLFEIVRRNILLYKTVGTLLKFFENEANTMLVHVICATIDSIFPAWAARTGGNSLTQLPEPAT